MKSNAEIYVLPGLHAYIHIIFVKYTRAYYTSIYITNVHRTYITEMFGPTGFKAIIIIKIPAFDTAYIRIKEILPTITFYDRFSRIIRSERAISPRVQLLNSHKLTNSHLLVSLKLNFHKLLSKGKLIYFT